MRRSAFVFACLLILPMLMPNDVSAQAKPFGVRDLVAMDRLSEPAVSPDGSAIVFTVSVLDAEANRRRSDLWWVKADGTGLRRLTDNPASDSGAVWHPDGKRVFFSSTRSGSAQVWQLDIASSQQTQVTSLPMDVGAFVLSPDGTRLVVAQEVFVDCSTLECTKQRLDAKEKDKATGQLYDRLFVRHWDTWSDGRRSHLFVVPVAGGTPVDIMKGMDADAPSKPFGGVRGGQLHARREVRRVHGTGGRTRGSRGPRTSTSTSFRRTAARPRRTSQRPTSRGTPRHRSRPTGRRSRTRR